MKLFASWVGLEAQMSCRIIFQPIGVTCDLFSGLLKYLVICGGSHMVSSSTSSLAPNRLLLVSMSSCSEVLHASGEGSSFGTGRAFVVLRWHRQQTWRLRNIMLPQTILA